MYRCTLCIIALESYQINFSSEGSFETFQVLKAVLRVEEAEHQGERKEVFEEIQHAVENLEAYHEFFFVESCR
jgi:hypothetical protein